MRGKNNFDRDSSSKDDKKETSKTSTLQGGSNFEHTNVVGNFKRENRESSKHNADYKIMKHPPKQQAEFFLCSAVNENKNKDIKHYINFPIIIEEPPVKERLEMVNGTCLLREKNIYSNYYEFPVEGNESNKIEALKCIEVAKSAFQKGEYIRAERFLLKSLRICDTQKAKSILKHVRNAKAQSNSSIILKTDKNYY